MQKLATLCFVIIITTSAAAPASVTHKLKNRSIPSIQALRGGSVNRLSNIEFWQTNYGELFLDITSGGKAGTFWPRGSNFSYIFGGGVWLGAVKNGVRHVLVSYNPASGRSWFQPGSVDGAQALYDSVKSATGIGRYPREQDNDFGNKFAILYSTDYDRTTGRPLDPNSTLPFWPIWDTDPDVHHVVGTNHYLGNYVEDLSQRDTAHFPVRFIPQINGTDTTYFRKGGPAFVSEEDMFSVSNDLDTSIYESKANGRFYPLRCEVQRTIYSWGTQENKNYIFIAYKIVNKSNTTLDSCWLAPVLDADIGDGMNDENGFYNQDNTLNLAMQWSNKELNVPNAKNTLAFPGVLGLDFLESPAVYNAGEVADSMVGTIKQGVHPNSEQLGLVSFKRWEIGNDPIDDDQRYAFMTFPARDTATNQFSDKRWLMSTGPFKLLPGQTAQVVVGLMIARDSLAGDIDVEASRRLCVALDKKAQTVYDSAYLVVDAALPPIEPKLYDAQSLDHAVRIHWDSLAEYSDDPLEGGLPFMGYRLYRSRPDHSGTFLKLNEWKLSDLDPATFQSLVQQRPSELAPASARQQYGDMIHRIMDSLTNHYTFADSGDDNHDGKISDAEELFNDVEYCYWIAAFDEGDSVRHIESLQTNGRLGFSKVFLSPAFLANGGDTSNRASLVHGSLGGISHFHWGIQNQKLLNQLMDGDTVFTTFTPHQFLGTSFLSYGIDMHVTDSKSRIDITYPYIAERFPAMFSSSLANASAVFAADTGRMQTRQFGLSPEPISVIPFSGTLQSTDTGFIPNQLMMGAASHSMRYDFYQVVGRQTLGPVALAPIRDTMITKHHTSGLSDTTFGMSRTDTTYDFQWALQPYGLSQKKTVFSRKPIVVSTSFIVNPNGDTVFTRHPQHPADTLLTGENPFEILLGTDAVPIQWDTAGNLAAFDSAANVGQCDYVLAFKAGGIEHDSVSSLLYDIPYLNVDIHAEQIYTAPDVHGKDSTVGSIFPCTPVDYMRDFVVGPAEWAMDPRVWKITKSDTADDFNSRRRQILRSALNVPDDTGSYHSLNRYYLTGHGVPPYDTNTLMMVNLLHVGGNVVFFDSAMKGATLNRQANPGMFQTPSKHDFRAGDQVRIRYTGGMLGLPQPGAGFATYFYASPLKDSQLSVAQIPNDPLEQIRVWPNPCVAGKDNLMFDRLPEQCVIRLYNLAGECIATIHHESGSRETYDLLHGGKSAPVNQLLFAEVQLKDGVKRMVRVVVLQ